MVGKLKTWYHDLISVANIKIYYRTEAAYLLNKVNLHTRHADLTFEPINIM